MQEQLQGMQAAGPSEGALHSMLQLQRACALVRAGACVRAWCDSLHLVCACVRRLGSVPDRTLGRQQVAINRRKQLTG